MKLIEKKNNILDLSTKESTLLGCVWYCDNCCSCNLKKIILKKVFLVEVGFEKIGVLLKLWLKLRLNKK
jgi:hypothetical protein